MQQNVHQFRPLGATPALVDHHRPHPRQTAGNSASHPGEMCNATLHKAMPKKMRER